MILPASFYLRTDVVQIAKDLLGKILVTRFDGILTSGIITETEAYAGMVDRASHAYGGRRTKRTEIMYYPGGTAYVYLCYGMYSLFNVVTNQPDIPHAILIRAITPVTGTDTMLKRRGHTSLSTQSFNGPGKVSLALGIHFSMSGMNLTRKPACNAEPGIWLEDQGMQILPEEIITSPRIGVNYAGEDAHLPYRFMIDKKKKLPQEYETTSS